MEEKVINEWKEKIDKMSQVEMAFLWRFAPVGHPVFNKEFPLFEYFDEAFKKAGGMTPGTSKAIGWK